MSTLRDQPVTHHQPVIAVSPAVRRADRSQRVDMPVSPEDLTPLADGSLPASSRIGTGHGHRVRECDMPR